MLATLLKKRREFQKDRAETDRGFTLIELLVVVVIIGILVAIAIPLYNNYKDGAANDSGQADVRNAVPTLEQCGSADNQYPTAVSSAGVLTKIATSTCPATAITLSNGNTVSKYTATTSPNNYTLCVKVAATGQLYNYGTLLGGAPAKVGACP